MEHSDESLIASYQNGDEAALAILIKRYFETIYRYVYRFVTTTAAAEDVVQETFIKVWKHADSFKDGTAVKPWLYRIAHNAAIDYLRKKKQLTFSEIAESDDHTELFADDTVTILEQSITREERELLTKTIAELPPLYREVVVLRGEDGLAFEEISLVVGKPINTVRSLYRRGLALLQQKFDKQ